MKEKIIYDTVEQHENSAEINSEAEFENASIAIAFYIRWCLHRNLLANEFLEDFTDEELKEFESPTEGSVHYFMYQLDHDLASDMLSDLGNSFTRAYYDQYLSEFTSLFDGYRSIYSVPDSEENFEVVKKYLDTKFSDFVDG